MTETFAWRVTTESSGEGTMTVSEVAFGDGYEQVMPVGINNHKEVWTIRFAGGRTDALAARDFLKARGGESFFWTPPGGVQGYYRARSYNLSNPGGDAWLLNAEFRQTFFPPAI